MSSKPSFCLRRTSVLSQEAACHYPCGPRVLGVGVLPCFSAFGGLRWGLAFSSLLLDCFGRWGGDFSSFLNVPLWPVSVWAFHASHTYVRSHKSQVCCLMDFHRPNGHSLQSREEAGVSTPLCPCHAPFRSLFRPTRCLCSLTPRSIVLFILLLNFIHMESYRMYLYIFIYLFILVTEFSFQHYVCKTNL